MPETLDDCWVEWIQKSRELASANISCCAPFLSSKPEGYDTHQNRVLLVGKATDGWYWKDKLGLSSDLSDKELAFIQRETNSDHRSWRGEERRRYRGFWNFMMKTASAFGDNSNDPQNLIWSNLFKIGNERGNPGRRVAEAQKELAIKTLKLEIHTYAPTIVIFTTIAYYEELVYEIAGCEYKDYWTVEAEGHREESWALQVNGLPRMLWTRHPARKSNRTLEAWLDRAVRL